MRYSDKLRLLAEYLDNRPLLDESLSDWDYPSVHLYAENLDEFRVLCSALGSFEKEQHEGLLEACHSEGAGTSWNDERYFRATVNVSGVCERIPLVDEYGEPVTKPKTRFVEVEGETEQVYIYHCPERWTGK